LVANAPGAVLPSGFIRIIARMRPLESRVLFRPIDVQDFVDGVDSTKYAAIVVQRAQLEPEHADRFLAETASRGIPVYVDLDDDLVSADAAARLHALGFAEERLETLRRLLSVACGISVSTQELVDRLAELGLPTVLIPNELADPWWTEEIAVEPAPRKRGKIRVLYMGSPTHADDLELILPAFDGLRAADGRRIVLELVGVSATKSRRVRRIRLLVGPSRYPAYLRRFRRFASPVYQRLRARDIRGAVQEFWQPFARTVPNVRSIVIPPQSSRYPAFVRWLRQSSSRWSLAVAPLADAPFNHAKSDLKFLECTELGLPTIASNVGPYAEHANHGLTLVGNDPMEWRNALTLLATDRQVASSRLETARAYVESARMVSTGEGSGRWLALLGGETTQE
jgi:hypothetical protein